MSNLSKAFRQLTTDPAILDGIDIIDGGCLPPKEAMELAQQIWAAILPSPPEGRKHLRSSFWGQSIEKMIWRGLATGSDKHAEWLQWQIETGAHLAPPVYTGNNWVQPIPRSMGLRPDF